VFEWGKSSAGGKSLDGIDSVAWSRTVGVMPFNVLDVSIWDGLWFAWMPEGQFVHRI
jgi:hypothetical protein